VTQGTGEPALVIRPKAGGAPDRKRLWFSLAFVPLVAAGLVHHRSASASSWVWYGAGALCLALITLGLRANFFAQTRIEVDGERIRRFGYFGRSAGIDRMAVARVVEASLVASRFAGISASWVLFVDANDDVLMRAYAEYYPAQELSRLRATLGVPWDRVPETRTFAQFRKDMPNSFRGLWHTSS
jgi:hypothetical protein